MRVYIFNGKELEQVFEKENIFNKDGSYSQPIRLHVEEAMEDGKIVMTVPHNGPIPF